MRPGAAAVHVDFFFLRDSLEAIFERPSEGAGRSVYFWTRHLSDSPEDFFK
jgi:hypothetical protein